MSGSKGQLLRSEREYVEQRAELLAQLVLTRRKDVEVISVGQAFDTGIDLFVRLHHPVMHGQVLPMFGVQVKGTSTPIPDEQTANAYVNAGHKHRQTKGLFLFPLVLFLFSVDGDVGYYSWLMKPDVAGEKRLSRPAPRRFAMIATSTAATTSRSGFGPRSSDHARWSCC